MSLRVKLFLSVGVILFIVALLSYFLPELFLHKDLDLAANYVNQFFRNVSAEERLKLHEFFVKLRVGLVQKISTALLGTVILSFGLGLFLLGRLSKKITYPIQLLAEASEKIGEGHFENLDLPPVEKRKDEIAILVHSFRNMISGLQDREKVRGVLNKVVSKEIAVELLKGGVDLTGEERVVTVLFSDIRGFTHLSEKLPPQEVIALLNDYMTEQCHVIDSTGGVVDKFVGDEIMALYGAPFLLQDHAVKAVEASLEMLGKLRLWNERQAKEGRVTFEIGIGIHTGEVYSGNMGSHNRLNYTVIGANVNLAARLCSAAKPMQIIVSEETWKRTSEHFKFQQLAPLSLKGVAKPVIAYEVLGSVNQSRVR